MDYQYFALAIQYFCLARISGEFPFNPASGNLYHLSFELLLKAYLVKYFSRQDLKKRFNHNLINLWKEFKSKITDKDVEKFDIHVRNLDVWERVRYITFSDGRNASAIEIRKGHAPKQYLNQVSKVKNHEQTTFSLYLDDMDELFQAIVFAADIDTESLLANQFDMIVGVEIYEKNNKYSIF